MASGIALLAWLFVVVAFPVGYKTIGLSYLLFLNIAALFVQRTTIICSALLTGAVWLYLFIPPNFAFHGATPDDLMMLLMYLIVALITGTLTAKLRAKEKSLQIREERALALYHLSKEIAASHNLHDVVTCSVQITRRLFAANVGIWLRDPATQQVKLWTGSDLVGDETTLQAVQYVAASGKPAGRFSDAFATACGYCLPLCTSNQTIGVICLQLAGARPLNHEQQTLLETVAGQIALGIEREHLHESLKKNLVMQESERIYTTLLHSVSHELKTPLSAIKGCATALLDKEILKNADAVPQLAQEIYIGSERMQDMIQNLLDINRIESQKVKMHQEPCDIKDVLAVAMKRLEKQLDQRQVKIVTVPDLPLLALDYVLIEQALRNILHNACIHTPANTPLEIDIYIQGNLLHVRIRDHGPGLPADNPQRVFEKFSKARASGPGGTGIGLFISKAFIELHGGVLEAANHRQGGACFTIKLRLDADAGDGATCEREKQA